MELLQKIRSLSQLSVFSIKSDGIHPDDCWQVFPKRLYTPENGWLEYGRFVLRPGQIFSGYCCYRATSVIRPLLMSPFQKSSQGLVRLIKCPTKHTTHEITQWERSHMSPLQVAGKMMFPFPWVGHVNSLKGNLTFW